MIYEMGDGANFVLASDRISDLVPSKKFIPKLYVPGEIVSPLSDFMKGHGSYIDEDQIRASLAGILVRINKLIVIKPLKARYIGEIGDVVVGRIMNVEQKRWTVDVNSKRLGMLSITSVNLLGGELRRRLEDDERKMRMYLEEYDLISAEVKTQNADGTLILHTRRIKGARLSQGVLVRVPPLLVKRSKAHFYDFTFGVSLILANNGCIWIYPTLDEESEVGDGFVQNLSDPVSFETRKAISRVRNCILSLAKWKIMIHKKSVLCAYEESLKYEVKELLKQGPMYDVVKLTRLKVLSM